MGLSFYYKGSFNETASLPQMIDEVKDIANIYNWNSHIFETEFPEQITKPDTHTLYGISISAPGSEPLCFTFLQDRRISGPAQVEIWKDADTETQEKYMYDLFCKTQFAGIEVHIKMIQLLKYISKKYFSFIKASDDGEYWETENEALLKDYFKKYETILNYFNDKLEYSTRLKNESIESYFARILKDFNTKE